MDRKEHGEAEQPNEPAADQRSRSAEGDGRPGIRQAGEHPGGEKRGGDGTQQGIQERAGSVVAGQAGLPEEECRFKNDNGCVAGGNGGDIVGVRHSNEKNGNLGRRGDRVAETSAPDVPLGGEDAAADVAER